MLCAVTRTADTLAKESHWHILFSKQTGLTCHISAKCQVVSTCKTVVRNESSAAGNPRMVASTSSVLHASKKKVKCNFPSPCASTLADGQIEMLQSSNAEYSKKYGFFPVDVGQLNVFEWRRLRTLQHLLLPEATPDVRHRTWHTTVKMGV